MLPDEINATLEQAENALNEETPHNAVTGYIYSEIAHAAFDKLNLFRSRGFSYAQICGALEKTGLLPKNSNPYSLRQAFHREKARLKRENELMKLLEEDSDSVSKEKPGKSEKYVTFGSVYPILNNYFGDTESFALYIKYLSESETLKRRISKTLSFPALSDLIADSFYTGGGTIPEAKSRLNAFSKIVFSTWRSKAYAMFEETEEFESASGDTEEGESA
jgi:hypothetical protein